MTRRRLIGRRFNGAATFRSRKGGPALRAVLHAHPALMGPRPFGRGRRGKVSKPCTATPASMGPRPFGRGRPDIRAGFRWAATRLQWGRDPSVAEGRAPSSTASTTALLQWGRDPSVAEGRAPETSGWARRRLQWGRDLSVAEGPTYAPDFGGQRLGFNGAATLRSRKDEPLHLPRPRQRCFNGAATLRSRKDEPQKPAGGRGGGFNGGRDLSVAEGQRPP